MIAAMVLGRDALMPMDQFSVGIVATATMVHLVLSVVYGIIIGWLLHRLDMGWALAAGAAIGLALYVINFYLIAPAVFPWFIEARDMVGAVAHVIFGAVAGGAYVGLRKVRT
jgi:hypothetical protein